MKTLRVRLPESLDEQVEALAEREGVSAERFVTTALTEKLLALLAEEDLKARAARGDWGAFERALASVPDAEPQVRDRL